MYHQKVWKFVRYRKIQNRDTSKSHGTNTFKMDLKISVEAIRRMCLFQS